MKRSSSPPPRQKTPGTPLPIQIQPELEEGQATRVEPSRPVPRSHPVLRQEYAIYTPPMDRMITRLGDWIDQRLTGGYVYGPSRYGKSRAVKWHLRTVLQERFRRKLPLVAWIRRETALTEEEFWNELLAAAHFEFLDPLRPRKKPQARFLFGQHLMSLARDAGDNTVVLLIDEAHAVTLHEWQWLLGLQNSLDDEGFQLSVVSVGSHQLDFQPNYLARTGNAHIAARFFAADARFGGLTGPDEVRYVLNGYDLDSEWPKGFGISYLAYFAPAEFAQGHRLAQHAEALWAGFEAAWPEGAGPRGRRFGVEVPMQHLAFAVEDALRQLAGGRDWADVTAPGRWQRVIASTGFGDHMRKLMAPS
jgi:hypothetical protein